MSPEDDIELRRIRLTNCSGTKRTIDLTSYAEVVLALPAADALHPAFSNLFVQTEIIRERQAILSTRRGRSQDEHAPWAFHLMAVRGPHSGEISYETDRLQFIGRGRTLAAPQALDHSGPLSGSQGSVLDPIVSIRCPIVLEPEESITVDLVSGIGETRDLCLRLVDKYQDRRLADRVFELAWTHSQVVLRQLNTTEADAQLYGRLAGSILYANASLRAEAAVLSKNRRGQSGLWGYAISGDLPIVLLAHQPHLIATSRDRVDLQISGHTHGGQMWPFHYLLRLREPVVQGLSRHGDRTQVWTSRGTGYWGPPFRIFAPSEISLLTLCSTTSA